MPAHDLVKLMSRQIVDAELLAAAARR